MIMLQLKTIFNLSPIYSARKPSNQTSSINHKISPDTNLHQTKHIQTSNTKFSKKSLRYHPVKKAHKARTHWYLGPFRRFMCSMLSYGSMLHIPPTNLLLLTPKQEPYKKAYLLTKNIEEFSGKNLEERASRQKKIRQKG